jgi:hypothetical protein
LLDALMRDAEKLGGVPQAEIEVSNKRARRPSRRLHCLRALAIRALASRGAPLHSEPDRARKMDFLLEFGVVSLVHPQGQGLPNSAASLVKSAALRMATGVEDSGDPQFDTTASHWSERFGVVVVQSGRMFWFSRKKLSGS